MLTLRARSRSVMFQQKRYPVRSIEGTLCCHQKDRMLDAVRTPSKLSLRRSKAKSIMRIRPRMMNCHDKLLHPVRSAGKHCSRIGRPTGPLNGTFPSISNKQRVHEMLGQRP